LFSKNNHRKNNSSTNDSTVGIAKNFKLDFAIKNVPTMQIDANRSVKLGLKML